MQSVQLSVDDEVKSLADSLSLLIADIKAKKTTTQIVSDALPGVLAAIGAFQSIGADLKKIDNQVYLLKSIVSSLE